VTVGDPAGIGPEIALRTVVDPRVQRAAVPVIIGDVGTLERVRAVCRMRRRIRAVGSPGEARGKGAVEVLDLKNVDPAACPLGVVSAAAGRAAVEYVFKSIDLAMAGEIAAAVTAPLNKEAIRQAGHRRARAQRAGQAPAAGSRAAVAALAGAGGVEHGPAGAGDRVVRDRHVLPAEGAPRRTRARLDSDLLHGGSVAAPPLRRRPFSGRRGPA
jgi:4-hydroxythreonine-4-phosphate dehydrogenase